MKILVIPEDFRKDQYILKPILARLLHALGRRSAKIAVCQDPRLGGVNEALKASRIAEIVARYRGMVDMFVLCVDRDGKQGRRQRLAAIEAEFGPKPTFLAENAWEELETWVLAGLELPRDWRWSTVRAELDVKEQYFDELARRRSLERGPGGGRRVLGEEAAHNVQAIRQKCPEDFDRLARRIEDNIQS